MGKIDLAVLDLLLTPSANPAPKHCSGCYAPSVPADDCQYCERYHRACGRHDQHTCGAGR